MIAPLVNSAGPTKVASAARSLYVSGLLLVAVGIFHIFVWLLLGGEWEGPVSWRKPILFGISTGVTLLSIAWLFEKLQPHSWDSALCRALSISLVLEVGLITLQQWRGQASHFNHSSTFDSLVEYSMTALIILATLLLFQITFRAFSYLDAKPDLQIAIRAGLGFLMLSCLIGFWVLFNGQSQLRAGGDPSTFGEAGVPKFPHGIAIHALQLFPILGWTFRRLGLPLTRRVRLICFSIATICGLLVYSLIQTMAGKARFDFGIAGLVVLIVSASLFLPVIWAVLSAIGKRVNAGTRRQPNL